MKITKPEAQLLRKILTKCGQYDNQLIDCFVKAKRDPQYSALLLDCDPKGNLPMLGPQMLKLILDHFEMPAAVVAELSRGKEYHDLTMPDPHQWRKTEQLLLTLAEKKESVLASFN